jgi:Ca2+-binding EF-hand superfamily protein
MTHRTIIRGLVPGLLIVVALFGCFGKPDPPVTMKPSSVDTVAIGDSDQDDQDVPHSKQSQSERVDQAVEVNETAVDGGRANPSSDPSNLDLAAVESSPSSTQPIGESDSPQVPVRPDRFGRERICILTDAGPLLVDLWLSIDGIAHRDALATLVDASLKAADVNGDGRPTWDELTGSDQFRYGRNGNLEISSDSERLDLIRIYDSDRDGTVDRDELPRFLTRNAGGSRSFNLRSSNYYRDINRIESPLRQLLDVNRDGVIDRDERRAATTTLRSRDADQNDILLPSEIRIAFDNTPPPDPLTVNRPSQPDSAIWLADVRQWRNFLFSLEERYALGRSLEPSHFSAGPSLFASLDENGDDTIDGKEIVRIAEVDPHIILVARFGKPQAADIDDSDGENSTEQNENKRDTSDGDEADDQSNGASTGESDRQLPAKSAGESDSAAGRQVDHLEGQARSLPVNADSDSAISAPERLLELIYVSPEVLSKSTVEQQAGDGPAETKNREGVIEQSRRLTLFLTDTVLILFANDTAGQESLAARAAVPFQQLDADKNGYLDEEEIPDGFAGLPSFAALDQDEDGKVFPQEVERFFETQQTAWRKQIRCRAGEAGDALFTMLDSNDDGRLTTREIEGAEARLAAFDRDDNGLSVLEIPNVMLLGIVRGDPQADDNSFRQGLVVSPTREKSGLPDWFLGMDRNDDLDLSRREFLGDDQQFADLDENGDGFIASDEVE